MKLGILVILFTFTGIGSFAQQPINSKPLVEQVQKINILYPGFEKEKPIGEKTTWGYSLGTRVWYSWGSYYDDLNQIFRNRFNYINLVPCGEIYGRWYYNIKKRYQKHKRIAHNSASYFTAGATIYFDGIELIDHRRNNNDRILTGVNVGWGWRRTFGGRILFDIHFKVQPTMENTTNFGILLLPGIHIGYLLLK
ncbi:MAG TPA: hypothetical protein VKA27_13260 [Sunxiuqinia sp.]|nr:hypothetical protein [Sunxiuqinia sp.]